MPLKAILGTIPVDFRHAANVPQLLHVHSLLSREEWQRVGNELNLSRRELELIQHIFEGKKLTVIARDMGLALGTVKTYSQRIHQKLGVSDNLEIALAVIGAHLHLAETIGS